jgi:hypothetical protein
MEAECPNCQQRMTVPETAAGQRVKCTLCGSLFAPAGKRAAATAGAGDGAGELPVALDLPARESSRSPAASGVEGWFVETAEGALGPLSNENLIAMARQGKIGPGTMLRHSRSPKVVRASEVPGLIPARPAARGPAPLRPAPRSAAEELLEAAGPLAAGPAHHAPLIHRPPRSPVVPILLAVVGLVAIVLVILGVMSSSGDLDLTKNPEDTLKRMVEGAESMRNGDAEFVEKAIQMRKEGKSWNEIDKYIIKFEGEAVYVPHPSTNTQELYMQWRDAMKKSGQ